MHLNKAIVIGGGIGGLAAAIALRQARFDVQVFERAPEILARGASLSIWSNGMASLRRLGAADAVCADGARLDRVQLRTVRGDVLADLSLAGLSAAAGEPSVCILRSDLVAALRHRLPRGVVNLGMELQGLRQDGREVTAWFADGRVERGSLLVGADGLHSTVRTLVLGDGPVRYAGYGAWLGVAEDQTRHLASGLAVEWWGRGERFGLFPTGGDRAYWYVSANEADPRAAAERGRRAELLARIRRWPGPVRRAVEATPDDRVTKLSVFDRRPSRRWGGGLVTLLGDAAHPCTPDIGQGACQALEDALALGSALAESEDVPTALCAYQRSRYVRTTRLARRAAALGRVGQFASPLACWLRDRLAASLPTAVHLRSLAWQMGIRAGPGRARGVGSGS